jgi:type IV pilus assembly protein PilO
MAFADQLNATQILEKMERLPAAYRLGVVGLVFVALILIYWFTLYGSQRQELKAVQGQLTQLEAKINESRAVASNLKTFQEKREQLKAELHEALRRLPDSKELPVLLTDITSLGKKSGLEFRSFKPGKETSRGFYAEVPIKIELRGGYHDVGIFFDRITRLDRIVNVADLEWEVAEVKNDDPRLKVTGTATTFRFIENDQPKTGGE